MPIVHTMCCHQRAMQRIQFRFDIPYAFVSHVYSLNFGFNDILMDAEVHRVSLAMCAQAKNLILFLNPSALPYIQCVCIDWVITRYFLSTHLFFAFAFVAHFRLAFCTWCHVMFNLLFWNVLRNCFFYGSYGFQSVETILNWFYHSFNFYTVYIYYISLYFCVFPKCIVLIDSSQVYFNFSENFT